MSKALRIFLDGMYPKQVSEWTKTKQAQMVAAGYHTGGVRPFGYTTETVPGMAPTVLSSGKVKPAPKRLVPHPEEKYHIRRAFQLMALPNGTLAEVETYLRSVDDTRRWTTTDAKRILTNDVYRGVQRYGANINGRAHHPLVSRGLWKRVQDRLAEHAKRRTEVGNVRTRPNQKEARRDNTAYYLRGRVFCESCGCAMTPAGAHGGSGKTCYYTCVSGNTGRRAECPCKRVNANTLHSVVLNELQRAAHHPTRMTELIREAARRLPQPSSADQAELERTRRNRRETEKKTRRLVEAIKAGVNALAIAQELTSLDQLGRQQDERIAELEHSLSRPKALRPDVHGLMTLWREFLDNWEYLLDEERQTLLSLIVDSVHIVEKGKGRVRLILSGSPLYKVEKLDTISAGARLELAAFGL